MVYSGQSLRGSKCTKLNTTSGVCESKQDIFQREALQIWLREAAPAAETVIAMKLDRSGAGKQQDSINGE